MRKYNRKMSIFSLIKLFQFEKFENEILNKLSTTILLW